MRRAALLLFFVWFAGIASAQDMLEKRVHFPAGQSGTVITGTIKGYDIVDYVLGASAGQRMTVDLRTSNSSSYFNVLPPDSETALFVGSVNGNNYDGVLPADGDFRIRVYLMRNAARRGETANYTLSVAIHGSNPSQGAATANPDFADGLAGGPDYWEVHGVRADDALNVRDDPSTSGNILLAVPNGTVFQNLGCRMAGGQRWCNVTQPGGTGVTGWVASRYLREAAAPSNVKPPSVDDAPAATDSASAEDKDACLAAVRATTNNSVMVLSSEFSEANTKIIVGVGPNRAPWQCLVSRGRVSQVMSLTDEGAL